MPKKTSDHLPHTESVHRVQESWEEFKKKANPPFEKAVDNITQGLPAGATDIEVIGFKTRGFLRPYAGWIKAGVAFAVLAAVVAAIRNRR
jgi:hypothetical protein